MRGFDFFLDFVDFINCINDDWFGGIDIDSIGDIDVTQYNWSKSIVISSVNEIVSDFRFVNNCNNIFIVKLIDDILLWVQTARLNARSNARSYARSCARRVNEVHYELDPWLYH